MSSAPTIKDVAREVGVHFTTVSMALRGHPRIPVETRERIVQVANRLGYRRNPAYTALSQRRSKTVAIFQTPRIAYLTNRSEDNGLFDTAHHRRFVEGAKNQAEAMGYHFELLSLDAGAHTRQTLQETLRRERIGGVILGAFEPGREDPVLAWEELCAVKIDSLHVSPALPYVANDQFHAVRLAVQRLRELGYGRIGLAIGVQDEEGSDDQHLCALLHEQRLMEATARVPALLFPHGATRREACPLLLDWIKAERIDAVISNWTSIRGLVEQLGFDCPGQVACASICLSRRDPRIAGVVASLALVGARAAASLAELMRADRRGIPVRATRTLVKGTWLDGNSAPPKVR